ncbi:MAG: hypothetical protein KGI27_08835 [Thaumarchaeota archaeon]|nr:hypothetical protein [Nitrososphaerota archaeon]
MEKQPMEQEERLATNENKKLSVKLAPCLASGTLAVMLIASGFGFAWADTGVTGSGAAIKATDAIKNNPTAMSILENIELFKQRWNSYQGAQAVQDQQNKVVEQQRALANEYLQNDLSKMENSNDQTTPQHAFANFVSTVNTSTQGVFTDEFNYMQEKIQEATAAKNSILQNGGTMDQALQAFNNAASTHKDQLVSVNNELNVKYHLANQDVQSLFDKWGQISRN